MTRHLAASVRARLLNIAKAEGSDFNQVLVVVLGRSFPQAGAKMGSTLLRVGQGKPRGGADKKAQAAACSPCSTESFIPTAFNTARRVFNVGLPLGDKVR